MLTTSAVFIGPCELPLQWQLASLKPFGMWTLCCQTINLKMELVKWLFQRKLERLCTAEQAVDASAQCGVAITMRLVEDVAAA